MNKNPQQPAAAEEETDFRKSNDWRFPVILGNFVAALFSWAAAYAVMILSDGWLYDRATDQGIGSIICIVAFVIIFVICLRAVRLITRR